MLKDIVSGVCECVTSDTQGFSFPLPDAAIYCVCDVSDRVMSDARELPALVSYERAYEYLGLASRRVYLYKK